MNTKTNPYNVLTLPHAYHGARSCFSIKSRPEDFRVTEELGFEPSGSGEHLYFFIEKKSLTTNYVRELLAQAFHVPPQVIGYSGLKDKHAITRQWFSIKTSQSSSVIGSFLKERDTSPDSYFKIISESRNSRKLKIGTHKSNNFSIILDGISAVASRSLDSDGVKNGKRNVNASNNNDAIDQIEEKLKKIATLGVPNYFGPQRFGFHGANIEKAIDLFEGRKKLSKEKSSIYISAARSFLFNELLAQRVTEGSWQAYADGDKLMLAGSKSFFTIDSDNAVERSEVIRRLKTHDIAIAGELYSSANPDASDAKGSTAIYSNQDHGVTPNSRGCDPSDKIAAKLKSGLSTLNLKPALRPLAILPRNITCLKGGSIAGPKLEVSFNLPAGAYATAVLKELGEF